MVSWCSWLSHLSNTQKVPRSSLGEIIFLSYLPPCGMGADDVIAVRGCFVISYIVHLLPLILNTPLRPDTTSEGTDNTKQSALAPSPRPISPNLGSMGIQRCKVLRPGDRQIYTRIPSDPQTSRCRCRRCRDLWYSDEYPYKLRAPSAWCGKGLQARVPAPVHPS